METYPEYADPSLFSEEEHEIGPLDSLLPATLTRPKRARPCPAVVLVHGSGPNDRDESLGPNRPFRDLAWGLASQGVAVLRYDKRTRAKPETIQERPLLTVNDETVDDAVEAVHALMRLDGVDPQRVLALGHSWGGYLMPRILASAPKLAGAVLWAAGYRPMAVVMMEQLNYVLSLSETTAEARPVVEDMRAEAQALLQIDLSRPADEPGPFRIPMAYWQDLAGYDPGALMSQQPQPLLVIRGEADYQSTADDFEGWQRALVNKNNVRWIVYPHLNHIFLRSEGERATPSSYAVPGHVDAAVIKDIAGWIHGLFV